MQISRIIAIAGTVAIIGATSPPTPTHHRSPPPADAVTASAQCPALQADYDNASKDLAMNDADGSGDNSAVRATMRSTKDGNTIAQARMTLDLMKAGGCKLPTYAPSGGRYFLSAEDCHIAKMSAAAASYGSEKPVAPDDRCDQSKWLPDEGSH